MVTTTNKGLAEPANGDLSWDVPLNANFEAIDKAFGSSVTISLTGLSTYAVSAVQAQNMSLNLTGTPSSDVTMTLPTGVGGQWVIRNGTTKSLIVSSLSGGAGTVTVPTGTIRSIYCDGTNVFFADSQSSGVNNQVAYTSGGVLTGSADLTFDGAELSVGASASITGWSSGTGTFTATFNADKLIPVGSSVTFSGVTTTPADPNGFNASFEVTSSTQVSGASTVTITATGIGASPSGGTVGYGNLKLGGTPVTASAAELNVLDGVAGIASQVQAEEGTDNTTLMTPLRVAQAARPVLGVAVASTSGTSVDLTGIPSWAKRVTIILNEVSTSSTSPKLVQIGDSGGIEATGYVSGASSGSNSGTYSSSTIGYILTYPLNSLAAGGISGAMTLVNISGNTWVASGTIYDSGYTIGSHFAGTKTLSGVIDRIRVTTVGGADTFDAGLVNIMWE